jgi:hypothetical protein
VNSDWLDFWAWHVLNAYFTGAANKDLGNEQCDVGFVAYYCFGQDKAYSDFNSEEHITGNVIEYLHVYTEQPWAQYMSCCPPGSKTNQATYYRCNTWTGEDNDNCHTEGLPFNDGGLANPGAEEVVSDPGSYMYSFPAEGEGVHWKQGSARRIFGPDLAAVWRQAAGGCPDCGDDLEDGCVGKCLAAHLSLPELTELWDQVMA